MRWSSLSSKQKLRRASISIALPPTILFIIPWLGVIDDPSLLKDYWQFYLLFIGMPYAVSLWLWMLSRRIVDPI
jgi:hypothetical protein